MSLKFKKDQEKKVPKALIRFKDVMKVQAIFSRRLKKIQDVLRRFKQSRRIMKVLQAILGLLKVLIWLGSKLRRLWEVFLFFFRLNSLLINC